MSTCSSCGDRVVSSGMVAQLVSRGAGPSGARGLGPWGASGARKSDSRAEQRWEVHPKERSQGELEVSKMAVAAALILPKRALITFIS